jgi:hypothetical protein
MTADCPPDPGKPVFGGGGVAYSNPLALAVEVNTNNVVAESPCEAAIQLDEPTTPLLRDELALAKSNVYVPVIFDPIAIE